MKIEAYKTVREWVDGKPEEVISAKSLEEAKQKSEWFMNNRYYTCLVRKDSGGVIYKYTKLKNRKFCFRCYISLSDMLGALNKVVSTIGLQYNCPSEGMDFSLLETSGSDFIVSNPNCSGYQAVNLSNCIPELSLVEHRVKELGFKGIECLKFHQRVQSCREAWAYESIENLDYAVVDVL